MNAAYFQQTTMIKSRFKHKAVRPKQSNLFYLKYNSCNFSLLNSKLQKKLVIDINNRFGDDLHMMEYWSKKLNLHLKNSVQGAELII